MKRYREYEPIKDWYLEVYPTDSLGKELKSDISFQNLFECLDRYDNVYNFLGVSDSVIRERLFERLSTIMGVGYDYIYSQWLESTK